MVISGIRFGKTCNRWRKSKRNMTICSYKNKCGVDQYKNNMKLPTLNIQISKIKYTEKLERVNMTVRSYKNE